MKDIKKNIIALVLLIGLGCVAVPASVGAASPVCPPGSNAWFCNDTRNVGDVIKVVADTLLFMIGAAAVIVIIIAGIRMVTSSGNSESVAKARNSIIWASIGVVVASAAYAIMSFVFERVK